MASGAPLAATTKIVAVRAFTPVAIARSFGRGARSRAPASSRDAVLGVAKSARRGGETPFHRIERVWRAGENGCTRPTLKASGSSPRSP